MSDTTIFAVGAVIFAVTIYGSLGSLLMLGLTRLESKDKADAAVGADRHDDPEPSPSTVDDAT
jgi:hypothetical protein